jgi:predicted acetyltransferase
MRAILKKDADALLHITSNVTTMKHVGSGRPWNRKNVDNFINYLKEKNVYYFGLEDNNTLVGFVGLHEHRFVNKDILFEKKMFITVVVGHEHQHKGYGTAMIKHIIQFGFTMLDLSSIYMTIDNDNISSKSMFIKKFNARYHSYSDIINTVIYIITPTFLTYRFNCEKEFRYGRLLQKVLQKKSSWISSVDKNVTMSDNSSISYVKSYLDGDLSMTLKHNLYNNTKGEPYTPTTIVIDNEMIDETIDSIEQGVWFLKPSNQLVGAGDDITILNYSKDIQRDMLLDDIKQHTSKYNTWVLQKEVNNRMLLHDMYFIVRYYAVVIYDVSSYTVFGMNISKVILHAPDTYISHHKKGGERILIDGKLYTTDMIYDTTIDNPSSRFHTVCKDVISKVSSKFISNGSIGYNIYGFDFIIQNNSNVMLLEINDHAQLAFKDEYQEINLSSKILSNIVTLLEKTIHNVEIYDTNPEVSKLVNENFMNLQTRLVRYYRR